MRKRLVLFAVIRFDLPGSGIVATRFRIGSRKGSYQHNDRCTRLPLCVKLDISMLINIFFYTLIGCGVSGQPSIRIMLWPPFSVMRNRSVFPIYPQDQWPYM